MRQWSRSLAAQERLAYRAKWPERHPPPSRPKWGQPGRNRRRRARVEAREREEGAQGVRQGKSW